MFVSVWAPLKCLATGWTLSSIPDRGGALCFVTMSKPAVVSVQLAVQWLPKALLFAAEGRYYLDFLCFLSSFVYSFLLVSCSRRPYLFTISACYFIIHSFNCFTYFSDKHIFLPRLHICDQRNIPLVIYFCHFPACLY